MRQERQSPAVHRSSGGARILRRHPWLLGYLHVAGFATLLALGLVVERAESAADHLLSWRARAVRVTSLLGHLRWQLSELENAERGFIITGDPRWVDRCRGGVETVQQDLMLLRLLVVDGGQRLRLDRLQPLIAARLAYLGETLDVRRREGRGAAGSAIVSGRDEALRDEIHRRISTLLKGQERLLAYGDARLRTRVMQARWWLLVGLLWSVPPLALLVRWSRRQVRHWKEMVDFQQANGRGAHGGLAGCHVLDGRPHMDR
ncbi:MAG TPA: CHASE3 domain-containing protein [Thermoanaerobaculia bacterium]|jgi:CHASE3 domain sensor protein|nr:CHASE3 domain-containing protein [Thermoanaerobaculia bacterium]